MADPEIDLDEILDNMERKYGGLEGLRNLGLARVYDELMTKVYRKNAEIESKKELERRLDELEHQKNIQQTVGCLALMLLGGLGAYYFFIH